MKLLGLVFLLVLGLSFVSAGIGFGMTDLQSDVTMTSEMNKVCVTYFLWNPGDVDIEGYLDVDRVDGSSLNKLLGLSPLYEQLDTYDAQLAELQKQYQQVGEGQSTFEIEKQMQTIQASEAEITKKVNELKPNSKINIPAHTRPKDDNRNYQIPIDICFNRPMKKYLFSTIGDTDFCGVYKGEIIGKYKPILEDNQGMTGSAILGSRSTQLRVTVQCNTFEKSKAQIKAAVIGIIGVVVILGIPILLWKRKKKTKQAIQVS